MQKRKVKNKAEMLIQNNSDINKNNRSHECLAGDNKIFIFPIPVGAGVSLTRSFFSDVSFRIIQSGKCKYENVKRQ